MVNNKNNFDSNEFNEMFEFITVKYKMTCEEKTAYKILLYWNETLRKLFPDQNHGHISKGDPRKSHAFKYCYKLMRETKGKLHEDDYKLYVYSQLDILRRITINNSEKPLIGINCLTGEKAWKRWLFWKSKYDRLKKQQKHMEKQKNAPKSIALEKVTHGLNTTFSFLSNNIGKDYNYYEFEERITNGDFRRWILLQKISPYYLLLSNFYEKCKNKIDLKKMNIELDVYKTSITEHAKEIYKNIFTNELI